MRAGGAAPFRLVWMVSSGDQAQQVFVKFSGMFSFGRGTYNHTQVLGLMASMILWSRFRSSDEWILRETAMMSLNG